MYNNLMEKVIKLDENIFKLMWIKETILYSLLGRPNIEKKLSILLKLSYGFSYNKKALPSIIVSESLENAVS